jgi:GT2 family glycosyltransferase
MLDGVANSVLDSRDGRIVAVVLNWNGWADTLTCLDALDRLTHPCGVMVVDNGSVDGSVEKIRAAGRQVDICALERNLGFSGGVNEGIRAVLGSASRPEFLWILNNDATPAPNALTLMVDVADADPRIGMVGSVLVDADGSDRVQAHGGGDVNRWLGTTTTFSLPQRRDPGHLVGASLLVRSSVFASLGGFDERYFFYLEDTDFSCRVREAGWRLAVADGAIVRHRHGASLDDGDLARSLRSDLYYARSSGIFLASSAPRVILPFVALLRVVAMTARRGLRRQGRRVPALVRGFLDGVRIGLRAPEIPRFNLASSSAVAVATAMTAEAKP